MKGRCGWAMTALMLVMLAAFTGPAAGQVLPDVERLLEAADIRHTEEEYDEMVEVLMRLSERPLDLNTAGFDSLKLLFFLSDSQIDHLLATRKKFGAFVHVNELLWVPGIGKRDLENIRPFVSLGGMEIRRKLDVLGRRGRHELVVRGKTLWPRQEGYRKPDPRDYRTEEAYGQRLARSFHGPPVATLLRYRLRAGDRLQAGLTLENDAGEGYFTRHQQAGADFVSAHLRLRTPFALHEVLLGDFKLQWGQGLVAWSGFASGKSDVAVGNEKSAKGLTPYTSSDENAFLRGVAVKLRLARGLESEYFFSCKDTDGNVGERDTLEEEDVLTAVTDASGYHRSDVECDAKDALEEMTFGGSLVWNSRWCRLGLNLLWYGFDPPLRREETGYRRYRDDGCDRWLGSLDYRTGWKSLRFFGEVALAENGALALVSGLRGSWGPVAAGLLYRRYPGNYYSHYAGGFGEYGGTRNEEGLYAGLELSPVQDLKLSLYVDGFRTLVPRYRQTVPGRGWEMFVSAEYVRGRLAHDMRLKYEERPEDVGRLGTGVRQRGEWRYGCRWAGGAGLELRSRVSLSFCRKSLPWEKGVLLAQDLIWENGGGSLRMQYRLSWFDTDSYFSRIYAYENNVLYAYSFPAFLGRGWRTYLNLNWKPVKGLTCYLKAGWSRYPGREEKGSGMTRVYGEDDWELTLQLRLTL